jgi:hypothetical protein
MEGKDNPIYSDSDSDSGGSSDSFEELAGPNFADFAQQLRYNKSEYHKSNNEFYHPYTNTNVISTTDTMVSLDSSIPADIYNLYGKSKFESSRKEVNTLFLIDSTNRDTKVYPLPSHFTLKPPRIYRNVVSIQVSQLKLLSSFFYFRLAKGNTILPIIERGRENINTYNNFKLTEAVTIPEGSYVISDLLNQLQLQMNYTPLFYDFPTGFTGFVTAFTVNGDLSVNFNQPGDTYYDSLNNKHIQNPTIDTIVGYYWGNRYTGLTSYTLNQVKVAYYYPVIYELLLDTTNTTVYPFFNRYVPQDLLSEGEDILTHVLYNVSGLNDPVILYLINISNISLLDKYRQENTFRNYLVNRYQLAYDTNSLRVNIFTFTLNTSLVNLFNLTSAKNTASVLTRLNVTASAYSNINTIFGQANVVFTDMYNFLQVQLANYFAIGYATYAAEYFTNITNTLYIQNGTNAKNIRTGYTSNYLASGQVPLLSNVNTNTDSPGYWPRFNTSTNYGGGINLTNINVSTSMIPYDVANSNFLFSNQVIDTSNYYIHTDSSSRSVNSLITINPARYSIFKFRSPVRQTLQVETLPLPYYYRFAEYNKLGLYKGGNNPILDPNGNNVPMMYFDLSYAFVYNSSNNLMDNSNYSSITINSIFGSSFQDIFLSQPIYTLDIYNSYYQFEFVAPYPPGITSGLVVYNTTLTFVSLQNTNISTLWADTVDAFVYHDRGAFMADLQFPRNENSNNYKLSNTGTVSTSDITINFSTFAGQRYYSIVRSQNTAFPTMTFKPLIYYPVSTYVSVITDYVNFDPLANPYNQSNLTNYPFVTNYNKDFIRLPVNSTVLGLDPTASTLANTVLVAGGPIGYDISGVSDDLTDYYGYKPGQPGFIPSTVNRIDPLTRYTFQSLTPFNSNIYSYFDSNSSNTILTPITNNIYKFKGTSTSQVKIVHWYDGYSIPQQVHDAFTTFNTISSTTTPSLTPYIQGFTTGLNGIQFGQGINAIGFLPTDGLYSLNAFTFKSVIYPINSISSTSEDPNMDIAYIGVFKGSYLANTSISLSSAITVLSFSKSVVYAPSTLYEAPNFGVEFGTWYEYKQNPSLYSGSNGNISGFTPTSNQLLSYNNMYYLVPFNSNGVILTYSRLSGSLVPYPLYQVPSTGSTYFGQTTVTPNGALSQTNYIIPSTIGNANPAYGPQGSYSATQSQYEQSQPITTTSLGYQEYGYLVENSNALYNFNTTFSNTTGILSTTSIGLTTHFSEYNDTLFVVNSLSNNYTISNAQLSFSGAKYASSISSAIKLYNATTDCIHYLISTPSTLQNYNTSEIYTLYSSFTYQSLPYSDSSTITTSYKLNLSMSSLRLWLWGGGGAAGLGNNSTISSFGGAGAYVMADLNISTLYNTYNISTIYLVVGKGGNRDNFSVTSTSQGLQGYEEMKYGGGGTSILSQAGSTTTDSIALQGGGFSGIFTTSSLLTAIPLLIVGGGGAGGGNSLGGPGGFSTFLVQLPINTYLFSGVTMNTLVPNYIPFTGIQDLDSNSITPGYPLASTIDGNLSTYWLTVSTPILNPGNYNPSITRNIYRLNLQFGSNVPKIDRLTYYGTKGSTSNLPTGFVVYNNSNKSQVLYSNTNILAANYSTVNSQNYFVMNPISLISTGVLSTNAWIVGGVNTTQNSLQYSIDGNNWVNISNISSTVAISTITSVVYSSTFTKWYATTSASSVNFNLAAGYTWSNISTLNTNVSTYVGATISTFAQDLVLFSIAKYYYTSSSTVYFNDSNVYSTNLYLYGTYTTFYNYMSATVSANLTYYINASTTAYNYNITILPGLTLAVANDQVNVTTQEDILNIFINDYYTASNNSIPIRINYISTSTVVVNDKNIYTVALNTLTTILPSYNSQSTTVGTYLYTPYIYLNSLASTSIIAYNGTTWAQASWNGFNVLIQTSPNGAFPNTYTTTNISSIPTTFVGSPNNWVIGTVSSVITNNTTITTSIINDIAYPVLDYPVGLSVSHIYTSPNNISQKIYCILRDIRGVFNSNGQPPTWNNIGQLTLKIIGINNSTNLITQPSVDSIGPITYTLLIILPANITINNSDPTPSFTITVDGPFIGNWTSNSVIINIYSEYTPAQTTSLPTIYYSPNLTATTWSALANTYCPSGVTSGTYGMNPKKFIICGKYDPAGSTACYFTDTMTPTNLSISNTYDILSISVNDTKIIIGTTNTVLIGTIGAFLVYNPYTFVYIIAYNYIANKFLALSTDGFIYYIDANTNIITKIITTGIGSINSSSSLIIVSNGLYLNIPGVIYVTEYSVDPPPNPLNFTVYYNTNTIYNPITNCNPIGYLSTVSTYIQTVSTYTSSQYIVSTTSTILNNDISTNNYFLEQVIINNYLLSTISSSIYTQQSTLTLAQIQLLNDEYALTTAQDILSVNNANAATGLVTLLQNTSTLVSSISSLSIQTEAYSTISSTLLSDKNMLSTNLSIYNNSLILNTLIYPPVLAISGNGQYQYAAIGDLYKSNNGGSSWNITQVTLTLNTNNGYDAGGGYSTYIQFPANALGVRNIILVQGNVKPPIGASISGSFVQPNTTVVSVSDTTDAASPGNSRPAVAITLSQPLINITASQSDAINYYYNFFFSQYNKCIATSATGQYIITTPNGILYISNDYGLTWLSLAEYTGSVWNSLTVSSSGKYMYANAYNGPMIYSTNYGLSWSILLSKSPYIKLAASANGQYLIATTPLGAVYMSSTFGLHTPIITIPGLTVNPIYAVAISARGVYMVVAQWNGLIYVSADSGTTWKAQLQPSTKEWTAVAISDSGKYITAVSTKEIWTSYTFGNTWNKSINGNWRSVAMSGNGQYQLALNSAGLYISISANPLYTNSPILQSTDGLNWTPCLVIEYNGSGLKSLVSGNGIAIAGGYTDSAGEGFLVTQDGNTWSYGGVSGSFSSEVTRIQYLNGTYYATGDTGIKTSTDGYSWSSVTGLSAYNTYDITLGFGIYVVAEIDSFFNGIQTYLSGDIKYSNDGILWNSVTATINLRNFLPHTVSFGSGVFVAGGSTSDTTSLIKYSSDGQNWNDATINSNTLPSLTINTIKFMNSKFIATGSCPPTATGLSKAPNQLSILTSSDGIQWYPIFSGGFNSDITPRAMGNSIDYGPITVPRNLSSIYMEIQTSINTQLSVYEINALNTAVIISPTPNYPIQNLIDSDPGISTIYWPLESESVGVTDFSFTFIPTSAVSTINKLRFYIPSTNLNLISSPAYFTGIQVVNPSYPSTIYKNQSILPLDFARTGYNYLYEAILIPPLSSISQLNINIYKTTSGSIQIAQVTAVYDPNIGVQTDSPSRYLNTGPAIQDELYSAGGGYTSIDGVGAFTYIGGLGGLDYSGKNISGLNGKYLVGGSPGVGGNQLTATVFSGIINGAGGGGGGYYGGGGGGASQLSVGGAGGGGSGYYNTQIITLVDYGTASQSLNYVAAGSSQLVNLVNNNVIPPTQYGQGGIPGLSNGVGSHGLIALYFTGPTLVTPTNNLQAQPNYIDGSKLTVFQAPITYNTSSRSLNFTTYLDSIQSSVYSNYNWVWYRSYLSLVGGSLLPTMKASISQPSPPASFPSLPPLIYDVLQVQFSNVSTFFGGNMAQSTIIADSMALGLSLYESFFVKIPYTAPNYIEMTEIYGLLDYLGNLSNLVYPHISPVNAPLDRIFGGVPRFGYWANPFITNVSYVGFDIGPSQFATAQLSSIIGNSNPVTAMYGLVMEQSLITGIYQLKDIMAYKPTVQDALTNGSNWLIATQFTESYVIRSLSNNHVESNINVQPYTMRNIISGRLPLFKYSVYTTQYNKYNSPIHMINDFEGANILFYTFQNVVLDNVSSVRITRLPYTSTMIQLNQTQITNLANTSYKNIGTVVSEYTGSTNTNLVTQFGFNLNAVNNFTPIINFSNTVPFSPLSLLSSQTVGKAVVDYNGNLYATDNKANSNLYENIGITSTNMAQFGKSTGLYTSPGYILGQYLNGISNPTYDFFMSKYTNIWHLQGGTNLSTIYGVRFTSPYDYTVTTNFINQVFYPTHKITLTKNAASLNPIIDGTDLIDYPSYSRTQIFYYNNFSSLVDDIGGKFALEKSSNFANTDTNSGYFLNSYINNINLRESKNYANNDPNSFNYIAIRAYSPSEQFKTLVRFYLPGRYDFGTITLQDLSNEYITIQNSSNVNPDYKTSLNSYNSAFSTTRIFGGTGLPGFNGSNIVSAGFGDFLKQYIRIYSTLTLNGVTVSTVNGAVFEGISTLITTDLQYILPGYIATRSRVTDPLEFSIPFSSFNAFQRTGCSSSNPSAEYGIGYNLGFAQVDTQFNTIQRADTFFKILDDYIYMKMNPEYNMNRLDISRQENFANTRDPVSESQLYNCKLLLNSFGTYSTTFVQNPVLFNPPIGKLDKLSFSWYDVNGTLIDNSECNWSAALQIVELTDVATNDSTAARPV